MRSCSPRAAGSMVLTESRSLTASEPSSTAASSRRAAGRRRRSDHSSSPSPEAARSRRASRDRSLAAGKAVLAGIAEVPEVAAPQRLDFRPHQLQLDVQLQGLRIPPLDHADAPGKPLRLVDGLAQFGQPWSRAPSPDTALLDAFTHVSPELGKLCLTQFTACLQLVRFGLENGLTLLRFAVYQRCCSVPHLHSGV